MSSKGISKNADQKQKAPPCNIGKVEKMAMEGTLPRNKLQSGLEQASVSPANSNENQPSYRDEDDLGQMQQDGPVDENSPHQPDKAIGSIESNDIEMRDLSPSHAENDQRQSAQSNRPDKANRPTESEPLDPNATVDGWDTLRGSTFVIVQEGPPHVARFTFRYEPNYTSDRFANTTDEDFRISAIQDRTASGKKVYRLQNLTRSPCSWVKIRWTGLKEEDKAKCKVVKGFSWISKTEFVRLCHGCEETARAKIKELWDRQEEQYATWVKSQPGSEGRSRGTRADPVSLDEEMEPVDSPSPPRSGPNNAPLNESPIRKTPEARGQTPVVKFSKEDFMQERGINEGWDTMNPTERETREVIARALYQVHKATLLENNGEEITGLTTPDGRVE
ncbi:hypothetical protein N7456_006996 [Penicillium angulare]|uniref:Uncharacterized protein n=1 Tax=Penicillium angulare TaxID=116970 RepID=A0A9W9FIT4_9EURO|nr:hypothetical protein N7456_006996 [Penicillium angulare]